MHYKDRRQKEGVGDLKPIPLVTCLTSVSVTRISDPCWEVFQPPEPRFRRVTSMRYDHQWLKKQHYSHQESRYLLDPIGKYGEANQHTRAAVQVPHRGIMLEHLRAQKNGEAHHASHEGVKPWKRRKERQMTMPSRLS